MRKCIIKRKPSNTACNNMISKYETTVKHKSLMAQFQKRTHLTSDAVFDTVVLFGDFSATT